MRDESVNNSNRKRWERHTQTYVIKNEKLKLEIYKKGRLQYAIIKSKN